MDDFGRYVQVIRNLEYDDNRPIKLLKRYLQCAGIISPVLDEATLNNIYSTLEKNLSDEDVSMIMIIQQLWIMLPKLWELKIYIKQR